MLKFLFFVLCVYFLIQAPMGKKFIAEATKLLQGKSEPIKTKEPNFDTSASSVANPTPPPQSSETDSSFGLAPHSSTGKSTGSRRY